MGTLLSIDQGTHASRAVLYDAQGRKLLQAVEPITINHIDGLTVEQCADDILLSVHKVVDEVLQGRTDISAASLATQRSTLVAWDRDTGRTLAPAISWMDRRCASWLKRLDKYKGLVHQRTGLPLSPHYLAGKMRWLLDNNAQVQAAYDNQVLVLGSLSSFLCFHLLQERPCVIDHSHALRSLLCDLSSLKWHPDLLALFKIDEHVLPDCVPTQYLFGHLHQQHIPLMSVCGDQNAALHAHGELDSESIIVNLGSGAFMLHTCGQKAVVHAQLLSGIAKSQGQQAHYLLEGTVNGAGLAVAWLQEKYPDINLLAELPTWIELVDTPPCFINAIGGLGSPWWAELESRFIPPASGDVAKQAVAIIESIVFLLQHNIDVLEAQELNVINISGGLSQLDGLCQKLADLSGIMVSRYEDTEATSRGAAWLVNDNAGQWLDQVRDVFYPQRNPSLLDRYRITTAVLTEGLKFKFR